MPLASVYMRGKGEKRLNNRSRHSEPVACVKDNSCLLCILFLCLYDSLFQIIDGEFSRGGRLRHFEAVKALDHDMTQSGLLVPLGILEMKQKQFNVVYSRSRLAWECRER